MAKLEFKKQDKRPNRKRELRTADIPEPDEKYSAERAREEFKKTQSKNDKKPLDDKLIEKKKQESKMVRVSEYNIERMKALETVLKINAHNEMLTVALDHLTTTMSKDEISTYKLLMESFNRI